MTRFVAELRMPRVVFGGGCRRELPLEVDRLGGERAYVLGSPEQRDQLEECLELLAERGAGVLDRAQMHVPRECVVAARSEIEQARADVLVAVGGGSAIGLAKALALETRLPIIALPTTYAGSEMTPIHGITEAGRKRTGRDPIVLPRTVIYDPELTFALPLPLSAASGMNAIAHAVEGLYAPGVDPVTCLMAEAGIRAFAAGLPRVVALAQDADARAECLYGAWLCGSVLGSATLGLHHKLCHTLGGSFGLPHAETHCVVLPHACAYNYEAARGAMAQVERALDARYAPRGLFELACRLKAPTSLSDLGMELADVDHALDLALQDAYPNPRPLEREGLRELLQNAIQGVAPS